MALCFTILTNQRLEGALGVIGDMCECYEGIQQLACRSTETLSSARRDGTGMGCNGAAHTCI
jgi:hypothetical protein